MTSINVEQKSDGCCTPILAVLSRKKFVVRGMVSNHQPRQGWPVSSRFVKLYVPFLQQQTCKELSCNKSQESNRKKQKRVNLCCTTRLAGVWLTTRQLHTQFICKVSSPTKKTVPLAQDFKIRKSETLESSTSSFIFTMCRILLIS